MRVEGTLSGDGHQRIVITGACGFIGANLCRYFAGKGRSVWAIDGPSGRDWRLRGLPSVRRVSIDLRLRDDVRAFIYEVKPSVVINCAAYGAYPTQVDGPRIYAVNFDAVRTLIDAIERLPGSTTFVQLGSSSEYGSNCAAPTENAVTLPDSDYAVSKVAATVFTRFCAVQHKLRAWVLRLYSVYGPYEDFSRLVPRLLLGARQGALPTLASPSISRDFVFVEDVCRAVDHLLQRSDHLAPGEIFNIGSGARTTLREIVELVRTTFGVSRAPRWGSMPDRAWDHVSWFSDPSRAGKELGWSATTSLRAGLGQTMRWLAENPGCVSEGMESTVGEAPISPPSVRESPGSP